MKIQYTVTGEFDVDPDFLENCQHEDADGETRPEPLEDGSQELQDAVKEAEEASGFESVQDMIGSGNFTITVHN